MRGHCYSTGVGFALDFCCREDTPCHLRVGLIATYDDRLLIIDLSLYYLKAIRSEQATAPWGFFVLIRCGFNRA